MAKSEVLLPAEVVEPANEALIFLNGPIQNAPDWQAVSIAYLLLRRPNGLTIASPRRPYMPGTFDYEAQVEWEADYRGFGHTRPTGVNMFWLPPPISETPNRAYAQTSRWEIAETAQEHRYHGAKMVVGFAPRGEPNEPVFSGERYIRHKLGKLCADVQILDSLEAVCDAALELTEV